MSNQQTIDDIVEESDQYSLDGFNTINESNINLETEILYYIEQKFPDYYHDNITKPKKVKIEHMSNLLNQFKQIGEEKEKYNLKWAIKSAKESFNFDELQKAQPKTDCFLAYDEVVCAVRDKSKSKIDNFSRRLSLLSTGVSLLDIIVSVALILIVTLVSHLGDKVFSSVLYSTLFIAAIALTKVTLDRFFIMPLLDGYGWRLFSRTIRLARTESIKINAVFLVLMESIVRKEPIDLRYSLIKKQKSELLQTGSILPLPTFSAPNPSDI